MDYICSYCNGTGEIINTEEIEESNKGFFVCTKCSGTGKLNWIENIFGKPLDYNILHDRIVHEMSKTMAEKIDEEFLRILNNDIQM